MLRKEHPLTKACRLAGVKRVSVCGRMRRYNETAEQAIAHLQKPVKARRMDLTGQRLGRLTVIRLAGRNKKGQSRWECLCDCGKTIIVEISHLGGGYTQSCGCLRLERIRQILVTHGDKRRDIRIKEYRAWCNMKARCLNPNNQAFKNYGGRGITVCARWLDSYENFLADMGRAPSAKHSVGRIDNKGNYEPWNCRWETRAQQTRNTRRNLIVTIFGHTGPLVEVSEKLGVSPRQMIQLMRHGRSPQEAAKTLLQQKKIPRTRSEAK
jgi:hypothetical protein